MCMYMTSKNISITEDVYKKLMKIKGEKESFSELFLRLLNKQKKSLEKSFNVWNLSEKEKKEIWEDLAKRPGRIWNKSNIGEIK